MSESTIEALARAIHSDYMKRSREQGAIGDDLSLRSWKALPEALRNSNRAQALDIEKKLTVVGCELIRKVSGDHPEFEFAEPEVEFLAKLEHKRWCEERLRAGWQLGASRDVRRKLSPYLVGWDSLTEEARDLDRDTVRGLPRFLAEAGFRIRRVRGSASEDKQSES